MESSDQVSDTLNALQQEKLTLDGRVIQLESMIRQKDEVSWKFKLMFLWCLYIVFKEFKILNSARFGRRQGGVSLPLKRL